MAIVFKGVAPGKRSYVHLSIDGVKYTFSTIYKEMVSGTRVTSEKWNGTTYERIHRVIRVWKTIDFNTGKIIGTRAEAEAFVLSITKSTEIYLAYSASSTAPVEVAPAAPWDRTTLESQTLVISDSVSEKGYSLNLSFKTSKEV